jgi:hypothetical protein
MKNLTILFILFSSISFSQQIDTDRPDQTESSSIIPHKSFQIESGFLIEFDEMNTSYGTTSNTLPTTLFRYGLFDWLELRLVTEYSWTKSGNFR